MQSTVLDYKTISLPGQLTINVGMSSNLYAVVDFRVNVGLDESTHFML